MLRHAQSLSRIGCDVDLAGFAGADLPADVANDPRIRIRSIASFEWLRASRIPMLTLPVALLRQVGLAIALANVLARLPRPGLVLMQNPPAFPAMPMILLFRARWRARLIIDWHNTTAAMLWLRLAGRMASAVRLVERLEMKLARRADEHFAASQALAERLRDGWNISATVVPDRATVAFIPIDHDRGDVPSIIAPTSWGTDEDFSLLADAALLCDKAELRLTFVITGNGEQRAVFERRVAAMVLRHVSIATKWFPHDAYPHALASADLGLSLHRSASGADIPMKIPEMLACGVPVCAFDCGPALREQLRDGQDGLLFSNALELAAILQSLCARWPHAPELDRLRASVRAYHRPSWNDEWDRRARPIIEQMP